MIRARSAFLVCLPVLGLFGVAGACGDDTTEDGGGADLAEVTFEGEDDLFPNFDFDTGLQCFNAGGGARCDAALACGDTYCPDA